MTEVASIDPGEISARLRPALERGHAALLVGGTVAERARWVQSALDALATPTPLVLRVRATREGASLADDVTACAEELLERLRAPGALYEDSSCRPLPALGGWLFRARSVRHAGLLVVLEEVDGFLDLRGDRDRAESALEVLGQLLEEREKRPISLLCTVRASDAAGAPAIPAAVAGLFDERASLGVASAVVRDPTNLVASLAGRSFTRGSLARAVAAWSEVADDESVIVFSSPLAPTMVPSAQGQGEEPELRWPSESSLAPPPAATTPEEPAPPAQAAAPKRNPAFERARAGWMDTLRAALDLRSALDTLGDPSARRSTRQLERAFSRSISKIPLGLEAVRAGGRALDARTEHLERRSVQALAAFERSFSEAYASAFAAWAAGATRPAMLPDLHARMLSMAAERGARATALLLCTGLRADAWPALLAALRAKASGISVVEEGLHWAARPVTVPAQRALLARGPVALGAALANADEPPAPRSLEEASLPRREVTSQGEFHRISGYRHALASARDPETPLSLRFDRARLKVAPAIASFVTALPAGSIVLLAADVGAPTPASPSATAPVDEREPSVFEVLVPHAFLLWGADRL